MVKRTDVKDFREPADIKIGVRKSLAKRSESSVHLSGFQEQSGQQNQVAKSKRSRGDITNRLALNTKLKFRSFELD